VAVPIQEDTLFRSPPLYGSCQFVHGLRPKGAVAELVTLSTYLHPRQVAAGNECEVEVPNEDLGRFVGAGARVIEEQEKKAIALSLRSIKVRGHKERIHFSFLQINAGPLRAFLERYNADFFAPGDMFGTVRGHEAGQGMNGCQALVPSRNGTAPALLQMTKEHPH